MMLTWNLMSADYVLKKEPPFSGLLRKRAKPSALDARLPVEDASVPGRREAREQACKPCIVHGGRPCGTLRLE